MVLKFPAISFSLFLSLLPTAHAAGAIVARYMRIELSGYQRTLSLAEVQVYSGNVLVSQRGHVMQSSTFGDADATRAIDGNTSGKFFSGSVSSTNSGSLEWWQLDLGEDRDISKIIIYNRTDCCEDRINPARIILRNSDQGVVWQARIDSTERRYEFDVRSGSAEPADGRNLLRNSAFQQSTNPGIPDYWAINPVATEEFRHLGKHYGIDNSMEPPVPGVRVLKLVNSSRNFPYLMLAPTDIGVELPGGDFTFSFYVKADRPAVIGAAKNETGSIEDRRVSTSWQRYVFTFRAPEGTRSLRPYVSFPTKAVYFFAAPQLEEAKEATPYDARNYQERLASPIAVARDDLSRWAHSIMELPVTVSATSELQAVTEYNYYTNQNTARIRVTSRYAGDVEAQIACRGEAGNGASVFFRKSFVIAQSSMIDVSVPIKDLSAGIYRCRISSAGSRIGAPPSVVVIWKLKPSAVEVRISRFGRFITINDVPSHIIGMSVRAGAVPPDWYFKELKDHGINTVFYDREPDSHYRYDVGNIKGVIAAAGRNGLKTIIGLAMEGPRPADWRARLLGFVGLIEQLKANPEIIGWYVVDEPSAYSWQDSDLIDVYRAVKAADPYRLAIVNWAYNGVPTEAGQQPRGTLAATDMYAVDYYPFMLGTKGLPGYTSTLSKAALTARSFHKPFFSWLQLFAGGPAWREPTAAELGYMADLSALYGGMIGYWGTKSSSDQTWEQIRNINRRIQKFDDLLLKGGGVSEVVPPTASNGFVYAKWKKGSTLYLAVLNQDSARRQFSYQAFPQDDRSLHSLSVYSIFDQVQANCINGRIIEWFAPYAFKIYEIKRG